MSKLTWFMKGLRLKHPGWKVWRSRRGSKLTWFMKGLRPKSCFWLTLTRHFSRPNWPDLWRDCDPEVNSLICAARSLVQIDLIYEGIATCCPTRSIMSEAVSSVQIDLIYEGIATRSCRLNHAPILLSPNWPDLWRDCDISATGLENSIILDSPNWPDLWRDCDSPSK